MFISINEGRTIASSLQQSSVRFKTKHNRFPIPLDAIDNSDGVLTQNSGH
jgi:hypothetical protein